MTNLEKRLLAIQQKIESLNAEVADLVALTSDSALIHNPSARSDEAKTLTKRPFSEATTAPVGLTRFHQLAAESA